MNKVKKIITFVLSSLFLLSGCNSVNNQSKEANLIFDELIVGLKNKDAQTIKSLFADNVIQNSDDLSNQIATMLEYFDGEVLSYDKIGTVAGGESYDNGKLTFSRVGNAKSEKVVTDKSTYTISFSAVLIDEKEKKNEGIWRVWIGKSEDDYLIIGISDMP